ncbi:type II toxin-antitoxin system RelE/ParE family toxin [Oxalobacteraceae bacterium]|nr:type II toxin-antitoxin system RelE/ParE family toxin [Oxalobacteraceae bacterium]
MLPILWRAEASTDLSAILKYIAARSPQSAFDLKAEIQHAVSQLPHHPFLYRLGRLPNTRELVVRSNYILVYRVSPTFIEILSVLHSHQQYP